MSTTRSPTLGSRIALAIALTIGFYALALTLVVLLLWLPYELLHATDTMNARLAIFCIVSAVLILYSIVPRPDKFTPPGPELVDVEHPRLFALLRRVADATGQHMPAHVYLVPELNAWVANRGGFVGIGSRSVMGIGLPTLVALNEAQFAAVVAHEFGHYHHGDVALGPWLHRLRQGIGRTLDTLAERNNPLAYPFNWYGKVFLRVTGTVSRSQEFAADALATRIAGSHALASGLEVIHAAGPIYDGYWSTEVMPALVSGARPPIAHGYTQFAAAPRVSEATSSILQAALDAAQDPFDTHPPLAQRLAAVKAVNAPPLLDLSTDNKAIQLMGDVDSAEASLVDHLFVGDDIPDMHCVDWGDVGREVWIPIWQQRVQQNAERLKDIRCADMAALAADSSWLAVRMKLAARRDVTTDEHRFAAAATAGAALALILLARGGELRVQLGEDPVVSFGDVAIEPFVVPQQIERGELLPSEWLSCCERLGIDDVVLSAAMDAAEHVVAAHSSSNG